MILDLSGHVLQCPQCGYEMRAFPGWRLRTNEHTPCLGYGIDSINVIRRMGGHAWSHPFVLVKKELEVKIQRLPTDIQLSYHILSKTDIVYLLSKVNAVDEESLEIATGKKQRVIEIMREINLTDPRRWGIICDIAKTQFPTAIVKRDVLDAAQTAFDR